jgi:hypothetical protein
VEYNYKLSRRCIVGTAHALEYIGCYKSMSSYILSSLVHLDKWDMAQFNGLRIVCGTTTFIHNWALAPSVTRTMTIPNHVASKDGSSLYLLTSLYGTIRALPTKRNVGISSSYVLILPGNKDNKKIPYIKIILIVGINYTFCSLNFLLLF